MKKSVKLSECYKLNVISVHLWNFSNIIQCYQSYSNDTSQRFIKHCQLSSIKIKCLKYHHVPIANAIEYHQATSRLLSIDTFVFIDNHQDA